MYHLVSMRFAQSVLMSVVCLSLATGKTSLAQDSARSPIRVLLVLGGCCHDYATQQDLLVKGITQRAHVQMTVAYDPDKTTGHLNPVYESATWAEGFDLVIHDECSSQITDPALIDRILEPHRKGLPAVILHCGMHSYRSQGYPDLTPWFEFTGLHSTGHGPQTPIEIRYASPAHEIVDGLENWTTIKEELYNNSIGKLLESATPLARGTQSYKDRQGQQQDADCVVVWTNNYRDTARVFATTLGHNNETVGDARYLDLVTRGLLWSCGKLDGGYLK